MDRVTGNFLVMATEGTFWELDPTGWGKVGTASRFSIRTVAAEQDRTLCWAIPAYGVTV